MGKKGLKLPCVEDKKKFWIFHGIRNFFLKSFHVYRTTWRVNIKNIFKLAIWQVQIKKLSCIFISRNVAIYLNKTFFSSYFTTYSKKRKEKKRRHVRSQVSQVKLEALANAVTRLCTNKMSSRSFYYVANEFQKRTGKQPHIKICAAHPTAGNAFARRNPKSEICQIALPFLFPSRTSNSLNWSHTKARYVSHELRVYENKMSPCHVWLSDN